MEDDDTQSLVSLTSTTTVRSVKNKLTRLNTKATDLAEEMKRLLAANRAEPAIHERLKRRFQHLEQKQIPVIGRFAASTSAPHLRKRAEDIIELTNNNLNRLMR